jgi:geranylgeranyl pyrophosphate synthase
MRRSPVQSRDLAAVTTVVEASGVEVPRVLAVVEERMLALAGDFGKALADHAQSILLAGGKRLRPLLVCLAAGVPTPESDALVRAAAAVELIHAATLVHDDVLDGAELRRGRPTVVAAGGRLHATATGDLLFSRAFAELAGGGAVEPVRILSRASSELASGELMQREDAWDASVTAGRYFERCRLKTAVLFRAACELGALCGGGDSAALGEFGERIGLAFQVLDDVLDITGPPERTGKPRGADLLDGTVTLPVILALEASAAVRGFDLRSVCSPEDAAELCDAIAASGALEVARSQALSIVAEAKAGLPELPDRQRVALEMVADGVVDRFS